MVMLSVSLLIVSLKSITVAKAGYSGNEWLEYDGNQKFYQKVLNDTIPNAEDPDASIKAIQAFGIGIRDGSLYFGILYSNNSIGLHKAPADGEDVLDW
jgi:hypothetical protein